MKKSIIIFFCLILFAVICQADERDVLKSLECIKGNVESGLTLRKYSDLLADAKVEINMAKRDKSISAGFITAVELCLGSYDAGYSWWRMSKSAGKKRKAFDVYKQESWVKAAKHLDDAYNKLK